MCWVNMDELICVWQAIVERENVWVGSQCGLTEPGRFDADLRNVLIVGHDLYSCLLEPCSTVQ
jgi:hypothetical protein